MHLLRARPGGYVEGDGVARIEQSPAPLVILSAADTDIALLAEASADLPEDYPALRLANLLHLRQPAAIDLYLDEVLRHARLIVVALLGGTSYWPYGVERLVTLARDLGTHLVLVPGDDAPDAELERLSTVDIHSCRRVWRYLREGGPSNARALFAYLGQKFFDRSEDYQEPRPLPRALVYHPTRKVADLGAWHERWRDDRVVAAVLFYRAHVQAANTRMIDALVAELERAGLNPLPIALTSLKERLCLEVVEDLLERSGAALVLNTTGFSLSVADAPLERPLARDVPVLQVILSGDNAEDWREGTHGLSPRDLAMNVVLPELDGRLITRAVSFKGLLRHCKRTEADVVAYQPQAERMGFVAELAYRWTRLRTTPNGDKRVALVLANYPTRDGRIGNGVGLDTPASLLNLLRTLREDGYRVGPIPRDTDALMGELLAGVTNDPDLSPSKPAGQGLAVSVYRSWLEDLPDANRNALRKRWGEPEADAMVRHGYFAVAGMQLGNVFVGIQPARGYHLDLAATYHDPDLVPPHGYLAFYCWLRSVFGAHAVVHVGKHGNLEWLPGKGVALSAECWPEAALGPLPHLYPFIVNDPGEGAQAKRRAQAVIIDHLVPPLTRAESYGPMRVLERLADEYYEALDVDPRRTRELRREILAQLRAARLDAELGTLPTAGDQAGEDALLRRMDAYLCELKEAQIRDGLHVLGQSPRGDQRTDTLLALARLPNGDGKGENASLLRALSAELGFGEFDPLECDLAAPWQGPRPDALWRVTDQPWRTAGDTRERLELFARGLLSGAQAPLAGGGPVGSVLARIRVRVAGDLDRCGARELENFKAALTGRFVPAGPSGAPSRGRLDVLPTGRNFYSVDVRAIPTMTAWRLGFKSAALLLERHVQEHGEYPASLGLSVWGTSTMRTGGDDIAQAMALLGVRPVWANGSSRVMDFEVIPTEALGRPRVDVTLRVSGFFRDAFSGVIRLFDAAVQAVAEEHEPPEWNPVRARVLRDCETLRDSGLDGAEARQRAGWRVFGSKPGAYGAGLQGLMDERCWDERADLAEAYINWGGYAYGRQEDGTAAHDIFRQRLSHLDAVVQNQDNREHDLLDSDDYYQFQGGMAVAVETARGRAVPVYHGDHAQPESPRIRTLKEEIDRVIRSRVVNPKWLRGVQRHGYKGAFEMAATVDYLFAYDATAGVVSDYQYGMVADAYLLDADSREFLAAHNPSALREMAERLIEAMQRGLWSEPGGYRERLEEIIIDVEQGLES